MSHAAVIARELGIPAVVGARAALTEIADGALVTVDPVAGRVTVVEGA
jgi:pyruvate,water dikinase